MINNDLIIGVSRVSDGNMSVNWGSEEEVWKNRERFLKNLGIDIKDCVWASLEAGDKIAEVNNTDKGNIVTGDALITREVGLALWILTADCFPVVFYDPETKILALAHLGRQGVDLRLGQKVINKIKEMGAEINSTEVFIAPGIEKESYKWKGKLPFKDPEWKDFINLDEEGYWHINSSGFIKKQLIDSGISPEKINLSGVDVFKDRNYFSHVRSVVTGEKEGRFATVVMRR